MFYVKIDLTMLGRRLSQSKQQAMSHGDVMRWLLERGFTFGRRGWMTSTAGLYLLQIREIIVSHPIE